MGAGIRRVEGVWDGAAPSASLAWSREIWVTEARVLMGLFPCPGPHLHLSLTGAHSLCFSFTIKSWSRPGQPWCEAQVFMNKNLFLQYNSDSNMVKPLGLLGKKVLPLCRSKCFVNVKQNDALAVQGWKNISGSSQ
uniref:Uncharacterized protein n=1 Tax=Piliocolobus tephrosceles TaxID=591936 RepID=A0A8C9H0F7_9PRIM